MIINIVSTVLVIFGSFFFLAGTIGLLRFPDVFCRLHALTKADNLGLGFIILGLLPHSPSISISIKMLIAWGLVLIASATSCHLIARTEFSKDKRLKEVHRHEH